MEEYSDGHLGGGGERKQADFPDPGGDLPSGGGGGNGTLEPEGYDGDRLRSRLVALGDLEESESEEESQGEIFAKESDQLLNIFPVEIWVMIMDNVKDMKTLESLHYASPYFRHLLLPKRELFFFPEVWNILINKFEKDHSTDPSYNEAQFPDSGTDRVRQIRTCDNCGRRRKTKWYSGILKLRLVCRAWSAAVDKSLEDPVTRGATSSNDWTFNELPTRRLFEFGRHFAKTHLDSERSPFLGRHDVIINYGDYDQRLFHRLQWGLDNFGRHINSVSICHPHHCQDISFPAAYQYLGRVFNLMPNLKELKIDFQTNKIPSSSSATILQTETISHPLPRLDKLQHFTCHGTPTAIFNEIIRHNNHLKTLEVDQRRTMSYDLCIFSYLNLQELSIKLYAGKELQYLGLPVILPSLRKLCLDFELDYDIQFPSIFSFLGSHYGETLTSLEIKLPKANEFFEREIIWRECPWFRLNLPKLVHLKLEIWNLTSFDFLLPMKGSLETIELFITYELKKDENKELLEALMRNQAIKIVDYTHRLLESNVWSMFPKLNEVKINETVNTWGGTGHKDSSYTRSDWERLLMD